MKILFVVLSVCLAAFILYFLFNVYFPKKNKVNSLLNINNRKDAVKFLIFTLLLVPLLGFSINSHKDQIIAESKGYHSYAELEAETLIAASHNLSLEDYKVVMLQAKKVGFSNYTSFQNHLLAQKQGYDSYQAYKIDLQFARSYDFPLNVYKKAKAEAKQLNFDYFDDYLLYKETSTLKFKLANIANLGGNYNIDSVPLGVKLEQLTDIVEECKISKIPSYSFPVTNTLAPRNKAYVNHFFPATKETASGFGLTAYSLNFSVMPALDLQAISKYEMKCDSGRYDLWFLNSDNTLVLYEKAITLPLRGYKKTLAQVESILSNKCDTSVKDGLTMTFEENGQRSINNLYCKNFQNYILATMVDGPIIASVRQDPKIHIGYLSDRLWKKYINNLHTIKGKKRSAAMIKVRNDQFGINDRI